MRIHNCACLVLVKQIVSNSVHGFNLVHVLVAVRCDEFVIFVGCFENSFAKHLLVGFIRLDSLGLFEFFVEKRRVDNVFVVKLVSNILSSSQMHIAAQMQTIGY